MCKVANHSRSVYICEIPRYFMILLNWLRGINMIVLFLDFFQSFLLANIIISENILVGFRLSSRKSGVIFLAWSNLLLRLGVGFDVITASGFFWRMSLLEFKLFIIICPSNSFRLLSLFSVTNLNFSHLYSTSLSHFNFFFNASNLI